MRQAVYLFLETYGVSGAILIGWTLHGIMLIGLFVLAKLVLRERLPLNPRTLITLVILLGGSYVLSLFLPWPEIAVLLALMTTVIAAVALLPDILVRLCGNPEPPPQKKGREIKHQLSLAWKPESIGEVPRGES